MASEPGILVELCNVLHRQALTQESTAAQVKIMSVISMVSQAAAQQLATSKQAKLKDTEDLSEAERLIAVANIGEGRDNGKIAKEKSVSFSILEVCLCILVQYFPEISPRATQSSSVIAMQARSRAKLSHRNKLTEEQMELISTCVRSLGSIMYLCSPAGAVALAPSVFYLITSVLQVSSSVSFSCVVSFFSLHELNNDIIL